MIDKKNFKQINEIVLSPDGTIHLDKLHLPKDVIENSDIISIPYTYKEVLIDDMFTWIVILCQYQRSILSARIHILSSYNGEYRVLAEEGPMNGVFTISCNPDNIYADAENILYTMYCASDPYDVLTYDHWVRYPDRVRKPHLINKNVQSNWLY